MAHNDLIIDSDGHFIIDPVTREITNQSGKTSLMQFDHNSERLTFEVDNIVEGHEMSRCNRVEIHYINVATDKRSQVSDIYPVDDLKLEDSTLTFSWLISRNVTQLAGAVAFVVRFFCMDGDTEVYSWGTAKSDVLEVNEGINNSGLVNEDYSDIINQWYSMLVESGTEGVNKVEEAKNNALAELDEKKAEILGDLDLENKVDYTIIKSNNLIDESTIIHGSWWKKWGLETNQYTSNYFACEVNVENLDYVTCTAFRPSIEDNTPCLYSYMFVLNDGTLTTETTIQSYLAINTIEIPDNAVKLRVNYNCAYTQWELMINSGTERLPYEPYGSSKVIAELEDYKKEVDERFENLENENGDSVQTNNPKIILGSSICAVVGDTIQIFYKSIIDGDIGTLDIKFSCAKGKNYPRYWEYTPTTSDVGNYPISIALLENDGNIIDELSCTLKVVSAINPSDTVNVLCVGDSTMESGQIPIEASRRIKGTNGSATTPIALNLSNVNFVGRKKTPDGSVGWEGTGGWTYGSYNISGYTAIRFTVTGAIDLNIDAVYQVGNFKLKIVEINTTDGAGNIRCLFYYSTPYNSNFDSTAQSGTLTKNSGSGQDTLNYTAWIKETYQPFWDNETDKWDILKYRDSYCNGKIDVICVLLGINDVISAEPFSTMESAISDAKKFFRNVHSQIPGCKIVVSTLPPISPNGGIASNYGASSKIGAYSEGVAQHNVHAFNSRLIETANDEEFSSYLILSNTHAQFDSENGYPETSKPLNTRISKTEKLQSNGVHPSNEGYWQIADALVFRAVINNL